MNLTARQHAVAAAMIAEVKAYGLSERAAVIVIETALVESDILVFANWNIPESLRIPHDGVGNDHASVGPLQQQVPMWGTVRDCMDPARSTRKFLDRLVQFNWWAMPTGSAAQRVQVSAFPDRYQQREWDAIQIVNALWNTNSDAEEEVALSAEAKAEINQIVAAQLSRFFAVQGSDGKYHDRTALAIARIAVQPVANDVAAIKAKDGA